LKPKVLSAASLYEGMSGCGGAPAMFGTYPDAARPGGRDGGLSSRYGGRGDAGMTSRYGGGGTRPRAAAPNTTPMTTREAPRPTGPITLLKEEPLRVTLGLSVVRMPEPAADDKASNN